MRTPLTWQRCNANRRRRAAQHKQLYGTPGSWQQRRGHRQRQQSSERGMQRQRGRPLRPQAERFNSSSSGTSSSRRPRVLCCRALAPSGTQRGREICGLPQVHRLLKQRLRP